MSHYHKRGRHKIASFDPSHLVKKTSHQLPQPEYQVQHQFAEFDIAGALKHNIRNRGYKTPTPIQDQTIPHIVAGKDVVGSASTGTGKTAAFLIPLMSNLMDDNSQRVLIMTPTRELALQIEKEFQLFAKDLSIYATVCIGGASLRKQTAELRRRPHMVIGTPGRLIDLTKQRKLNVSQFSVVVLDEADRMLDMGFIHDMEFMIGRMPSPRQTLFFSATIPDSLGTIIKKYTNNPVTVAVNPQRAAANVDQDIVRMNGRSKVEVLHQLLSKNEFEKVLVFGRTKHGLNRLSKKLHQKGHRVDIIHGNKSQNQRKRALQNFKQDRVDVLLATDVASRGLDIKDVTHVINYDLPESKEVYIHRIGRTGRAGKTGTALSFIE